MYAPAYLKDMVAYINNPATPMYGMWNAPDAADVNGPFGPGVPGEGGVDLTSPTGTPVYALATGKVVGVGYWNDVGHGVVTTRVSIPGYGSHDLYYQHIIPDNSIKLNDTVQAHQKIGVIGEYGEIEMGLNANWGGIWGSNHPQGWVKDPRPQIKALMLGSTSTASGGTDIIVRAFMDQVLTDISSGSQSFPQEVHNFMIGWAQQEGGGITNSAKFNPLNTKRVETGSVDAGHGIQAYPDDGTGITATKDALLNGLYPNLVHALSTGDLQGLGFQARNNAHAMSSNIASELMIWNYGSSNLLNADDENYILNIMQLSGISNASIIGGNIESNKSGQSQAGIDAYGNRSLGPDTSGVTVGGAATNAANQFSGINNFFTQLSGFFSNPVRLIKIMLGAILIATGIILLIKELVPGSVKKAASTAKRVATGGGI